MNFSPANSIIVRLLYKSFIIVGLIILGLA